MRPFRLPSLLLLAAVACSSGGSGAEIPGATPTPRTVRMESADGSTDLQITRTDPTARHRLQASADDVWKALPGIYAELKIPVTTLVTAEKRLGNQAHRVRRQLGGERLSRYLDCGQRLGERNADTYEVVMHVETAVRPAEGGSTLVTAISANARPMGTSGNMVNCTSTGQLEERILELLAKATNK